MSKYIQINLFAPYKGEKKLLIRILLLSLFMDKTVVKKRNK